jgi:hypothetical protein
MNNLVFIRNDSISNTAENFNAQFFLKWKGSYEIQQSNDVNVYINCYSGNGDIRVHINELKCTTLTLLTDEAHIVREIVVNRKANPGDASSRNTFIHKTLTLECVEGLHRQGYLKKYIASLIRKTTKDYIIPIFIPSYITCRVIIRIVIGREWDDVGLFHIC